MSLKPVQRIESRCRGFTLVELLVATSIFAVVLIVVVGAYARFAVVQRQYIGEQSMQEDIRLVLQLFNREARTGFGTTFVAIPNEQGNDGRAITFRNQNRVCVKYELNSEHQLTRAEETPADPSASCDPRQGAVTYTNERIITDPDTTVIDDLFFLVHEAKVHPDNPTLLTSQGIIRISLQVRPSILQPQSTLLQSAVVSRQFRPYTP